jgi:hypothetical protein
VDGMWRICFKKNIGGHAGPVLAAQLGSSHSTWACVDACHCVCDATRPRAACALCAVAAAAPAHAIMDIMEVLWLCYV